MWCKIYDLDNKLGLPLVRKSNKIILYGHMSFALRNKFGIIKLQDHSLVYLNSLKMLYDDKMTYWHGFDNTDFVEQLS